MTRPLGGLGSEIPLPMSLRKVDTTLPTLGLLSLPLNLVRPPLALRGGSNQDLVGGPDNVRRGIIHFASSLANPPSVGQALPPGK